MKNKNLVIGFVVGLVLVGVIFGLKTWVADKSEEEILEPVEKMGSTEAEPTVEITPTITVVPSDEGETAEPTDGAGRMTEEEIEEYLLVYESPFVVTLRTSIDDYLLGNIEGSEYLSETAVEESEDDERLWGLDSFDGEYYQGKFVVLAMNDGVAGGKYIDIFFQDKPDEIFTAWVYDLAGGGYELRSFSSAKGSEEEEIKNLEDFLGDIKFYNTKKCMDRCKKTGPPLNSACTCVDFLCFECVSLH